MTHGDQLSDPEVLNRCFEDVAQSGIDIAPMVYQTFLEAMPEADQHIGYMDERMRGRMLDQIFNLLLDDIDTSYLEFETRTHRGYGANSRFYRGMLEAVRDAVKRALKDGWSTQYESAFTRSIDQIVEEIERLESPSPA